MTLQKRFIVVFTSKDGITFSRAVVWDDDFLNSALIGRATHIIVGSPGPSSIRAVNLVHEINNLQNGYSATLREYDTFNSIPDEINIEKPILDPMTTGSLGHFKYMVSGSIITIYTD